MRDRGSPDPIIAYHGTPYSFDKFDPAHIGAGEGNQAYGHGLYFAGHEPVSEWYRHQLSARRDPLLQKYGLDSEDGAQIGIRLAAHNGDTAQLIADTREGLQRLREENRTDAATKNMIKRRESEIAYLQDPERATGHLYEVAIDAPGRFLDWDKSLADQHPDVQAAVKPVLEANRQDAIAARERMLARPRLGGAPRSEKEIERLKKPLPPVESIKGEQIYNLMGMPAKNAEEGHPRSSRRLKEMGIPGIRYLDQGSRRPNVVNLPNGKFYADHPGSNANTLRKGTFDTLQEAEAALDRFWPPQTSNYVTFDAPRLLKRYAAPGLVGTGGFGSLAPGREE